MIKDIMHDYKINDSMNKDLTSSQGFEKKIYELTNNDFYQNNVQGNNYYNSFSKNTDVFDKVIKEMGSIENESLRENLLEFTRTFTSILSNLKEIPNFLPAFILTVEEDSLFLEWVFKDFRVGFTISVSEDESMWFMITNKNLEELSVSGDLKSSDYYSVILRILGFVLENT